MPRPRCSCATKTDIRCNAEHCDRVRPGEPYTLDQCRVCWLFHHREKHRLAWGGDGKNQPLTFDPQSLPAQLVLDPEGTKYREYTYALDAMNGRVVGAVTSRIWRWGDRISLIYRDGEWRLLLRRDSEPDDAGYRGHCRHASYNPLRLVFDVICPCCGRASAATVTAA